MKKLFLLLVTSIPVYSQLKMSESNPNVLKVNLLGFTSGSFVLQYERLVTPKTSIMLGVNYMPKRSIPFFNHVKDIVKDEGAIDLLKDVKMSAFSVTPEVRFYLGKEGLKGFYIAPFLRYDRFNVALPIDYIYQDKPESVTINGDVDAFSGGLALGAQFALSNKVYVDVTFVGISYGFASGELGGKRNLNAEEQQDIRDVLNDVHIEKIDYSYNVHEQGVDVDLNGPWANAKLAVAIGYRF